MDFRELLADFADFEELGLDNTDAFLGLPQEIPSANPICAADSEGIVCFGMIHNVDVKLVGKMNAIYSNLNVDQTGYEDLELIAQEDHVILRYRQGQETFGYLRSSEAKTLTPLLARSSVEFKPKVSTANVKETIKSASKPADAVIQADINVYGQHREAVKVGKTLSEGKLWLQKSGSMRPGVDYYNPHFFQIEIHGEPLQSAQPENQTANREVSNKKRRERRLQAMVEEVYNSMDKTRHLDIVESVDGVSQTLLKHQQGALGFMLERETGHINDKYRLWEPIVSEDGIQGYRHKITRAKAMQSNWPDERGGGILADDMGMGKSLSVLALIMKTLNDSKEWTQQQDDNSKEKQALKHSSSTLIVVPSALLIHNWINEVKKHLTEGLRVVKYHGNDRPKDMDTILHSDIVITTFNTLTSEFKNKAKPSLLGQIGWYRVVLDEAHVIRRQTTTFYHACVDLQANSRWCLTGTPIQNRLADLAALFAFIRAEPFSKTAVFRKWIEVPFEQAAGDFTVIKNRLVLLLDAVCLRRTRDVIQLPRLRQRLRKLQFSKSERDKYDSTVKIMARRMKLSAGEFIDGTRMGLFQTNLQMRLLCNHGTFQHHFSWFQDEREAILSMLSNQGQITCSLCQNPMPILESSWQGNEKCSHILCSECLDDLTTPDNREQARHCPLCKKNANFASAEAVGDGDVAMQDMPAKPVVENDSTNYFNDEGYSTKMQALVDDIKTDLRTTKSIVFSCWTRTLCLLSKHLDKAGIPHLQINGSSPFSQRQAKLSQFANDTQMPVLIMTTGTGGFGLNLTCASRIFIVELQWNPAVESQAIARAIRLGQENEVCVTRYVVTGTVEEDMMGQQKFKKQLAAIGFEDLLDAMDE